MDSVEDGAGLRLDGTISHLPSGEQVWYDTTAVHTTSSTKIKAKLVLTRKRIAAGKEEGKKMVSAGLMATHQKKLDRYVIPGVWAACLIMLIPLRVVPKVDVAATARLTGFFVVLLVLFLAS